MKDYRVVDLQTETVDPETKTVKAPTPERAAELVLGCQLVRSGTTRNLRARVYSQQPGQPMSMVRLYAKVADGENAQGEMTGQAGKALLSFR